MQSAGPPATQAGSWDVVGNSGAVALQVLGTQQSVAEWLTACTYECSLHENHFSHIWSYLSNHWPP